MSALRCKIIIDGDALADIGRTAVDSPAMRRALESEEARRLVWGHDGSAGISQLCRGLNALVSKALQEESDGAAAEESSLGEADGAVSTR